jgi:hypothetical protein
LLKITFELKKYLLQKLKLEKIWNVGKATIDKQVGSSIPKGKTIVVAIDIIVIQI